MSVALHCGPQAEDFEPRGPNPEYLAFALEMIHGDVADLQTPVMQRIAAVWRGDGSFEERMMATLQAARAEGGNELWLAITSAPADYLAYRDWCYREHFREMQCTIATIESDTIREAREVSMKRQLSDYWENRLRPYRISETQPEA